MNKILIIFRKELKDMLRDRRTIFFMIIFPVILLPLMIGGIPKLMMSVEKNNQTKNLTFAVIGKELSPEIVGEYESIDSLTIVTHLKEDDIKKAIHDEEINGALIFHPNFRQDIDNMHPAGVTLYFKSSDDLDTVEKRIMPVLNNFSNKILEDRYELLKMDGKYFQPLEINKVDLASIKEKLGKLVGGMLPYIFIIYCFMGAMYPALDLGAGEKERGTLETILASPASHFEILMGKFGVISFFGVTSAFMGIIGMLIGVRFISEIPEEIMSTVMSIVEVKTVVIILTLILPVAMLFASILLSISIYASSFKEGQSIMAPFNILIIFPAFIGLIPGIELGSKTALIPIVNITLATKEIIAGTINIFYLVEVYLSLIALACIGIWFASRWFNRESVLFRD